VKTRLVDGGVWGALELRREMGQSPWFEMLRLEAVREIELWEGRFEVGLERS
jgi:hypothetical protein